MAINASSLFSHDELSYRDMLEDGGILIDDKWFPRGSSEDERARYHALFLKRQERNARRREHRRAVVEPKPRAVHMGVSQSQELRQANRLPLERRKCLRRSTVSECPTPAEVRTAWRFRNDSLANRLRLGSILMDLECYLDNSLIVIFVRHHSQILGRNGGLRAWIGENCPELAPHYKTLQRIKGMAKLVRQRLGVLDPVPLSAVMDGRLSELDVRGASVHVQPRHGEAFEVRNRFAWEESDIRFDASGRPYLMDENYYLARRSVPAEVARNLPGLRAILRAAIILNGKDLCANENYSNAGVRREGVRSEIRGLVGGFGEMCGYIRRHPEFLAEAGMELVRDVGRELRETVLPERTNRRILDGERVGVGHLLLDLLDAYMKNVYMPCLVYRWRRIPYNEMERDERSYG